MRLIIYIFAICFATLGLGFTHFSLPVYITGHLKNSYNDDTAFTHSVLIFVKGNHKILARSFTDLKGNFSISFTGDRERTFDFYCAGLGIDTILIASFTTFQSDRPEITFFIPGKIKRNSFGKVICPICKRADDVYKIQYGDAPVFTFKVSDSGDTTYNSIYKGKYQAGCIGGPAKYYCDRDKAKF